MDNERHDESAPDDQSDEALVLADLAAIVDQEHLRLRRERQLRRLGRALQRLGITSLTGGSWTVPDEEAEVVFRPIKADRFIMLIAHLEDLADLIKDQKQVPAPVTVGGVHIHHVDQLQINLSFDTQPPTTS